MGVEEQEEEEAGGLGEGYEGKGRKVRGRCW
jgi:hypothetical protein